MCNKVVFADKKGHKLSVNDLKYLIFLVFSNATKFPILRKNV